MLSLKQIKHVCYGDFSNPSDQCRYLEQDDLDHSKYYCLKLIKQKKHMIDTRVCYPSIHSTEFYAVEGNFPESDTISKKGVFLPTHFSLNNNEILYICTILKLFYA